MPHAKKVLTLCLVYQKPRILLGMKKRGFGMGKWNGFGGKVEAGEAIEAATRREVKEEAGIAVGALVKRAVIEFEFEENPEMLEVHLFRTDTFEGTPAESDEMKPQWFDETALPFGSMWPDDAYWMPLFFAGKTFTGKFLFDKDGKTILNWQLNEVDTLA